MSSTPFKSVAALLRKRKATEDTVEEYLRKRVHRLTGVCAKLQLLPGWPDRLVLLPGGVIFFVETKRPHGGRFEPLQPRIIRMLRSLGQKVYVWHTKEAIAAYFDPLERGLK